MNIHVVSNLNYMGRYGSALTEAFNQLGHFAFHYIENDGSFIEKVIADIHVICSPTAYPLEFIRKLPGFKVGILTEQLPYIGQPTNSNVVHRFKQVINYEQDFDLLVEWTPGGFDFLCKQGNDDLKKKLIHYPHGYVHQSCADWINSDERCEHELVFLGDITNSPRRRKILSEIILSGINIYPYHENVWGQQKIDALSNSRMVLNLHHAEAVPSFEIQRIFDVAPYKRPIISEPMFGCLKIFNGVTTVSTDNLVDTIKTMLKLPSDIRFKIGDSLCTNAKAYNLLDLAIEILRRYDSR